MNDEIKAWLKSDAKDYDSGIALMNKVCKNKYLLRSLRSKKNLYTQQKIVHELKKYITYDHEDGHAQQTPPDMPIHRDTIAHDESAFDLNNMTQDQTKIAVEKLEIALSKMYNKRGMLSNSLRNFDVKDDAARARVLRQI